MPLFPNPDWFKASVDALNESAKDGKPADPNNVRDMYKLLRAYAKLLESKKGEPHQLE